MINGAKLEVTVLIDQDLLAEIEGEGWSETAIEKAICDGITFRHTVPGALGKSPILQVESVYLRKYY